MPEFSSMHCQHVIRLICAAAISTLLVALPDRAAAQGPDRYVVSGTYSGTARLMLVTNAGPTAVDATASLAVSMDGEVELSAGGCRLTGELTSGSAAGADLFDFSGPARISDCTDGRFNVTQGFVQMASVSSVDSRKYAQLFFSGSNAFGHVTVQAPSLLRLTVADGQLANGQCGSANGGVFSLKPSANLCAVGITSLVAGTGPWTWTCSGINGGVSASCSARREQAPANDNFADATRLNGAPVTTSWSNVGASIEANEPRHAGVGSAASIWFAWTAPTTGWVTVDTQGTNLDTLLAVYTGTVLRDLVRVAGNDDVEGTSGGPSRLTFNATSGVDYKIAVDVYRGDPGAGVLRIAYGVPSGFLSGSCGLSDQLRLQSAPTSGLCQTGTPTAVAGSGPWTWSCVGINGGPTATCSAQRAAGTGVPVCTLTPPVSTLKPNQGQTYAVSCTNNPTEYRWYWNSALFSSGPGRFQQIFPDPGPRNHLLQVVANNAAGSSAPVAAHMYVSRAADSEAYQGAWWAGAAENGWGLSLIQHGQGLVVGWYYFDDFGRPVWAVIPGCNWETEFKRCSGFLMASRSAWLGNYDATMLAQAAIGFATLAFTDANNGTLTWDLGSGAPVTRQISRLQYRSGVPPSGIDYSDIWWGGPAENGWGVSILQQGAAFAGVWYTYEQDGRAVWYLINGGNWVTPTQYSGPLFKATGSPVASGSYNASAFSAQQAGTISINFTSGSSATISYTVDGVTQTKTVERLFF